MKKTTFLSALILTLVSFSAFSADYRIRRVETLGDLKHKVIFQSRDLKKVPQTNILTGRLVVMWGVHRYQIVDGYYTCSAKNFCKLYDYKHVAMYEKCVVKKKKVDCTKLVTRSSYDDGSSNDIRVYEDPDRVYDEFDNGRDHWDYEPEFPVRINDEFPGLHF